MKLETFIKLLQCCENDLPITFGYHLHNGVRQILDSRNPNLGSAFFEKVLATPDEEVIFDDKPK